MALMLTKNGLRAFSTMQHQEFSLRQRMTGGPLSHHKSIEIQSKETYFFMLQWIFHLHFGQGACVLLRPPEQKQLDRSDGDGAGPGRQKVPSTVLAVSAVWVEQVETRKNPVFLTVCALT